MSPGISSTIEVVVETTERLFTGVAVEVLHDGCASARIALTTPASSAICQSAFCNIFLPLCSRGSDGSDGDLEHVGDLVVCEVFHEIERADDAVLDGKLADRLHHALTAEAVDQDTGGIVAAARQTVANGIAVEVDVGRIVELDGLRAALCSAMPGVDASYENAKEPRLEVGTHLERLRRAAREQRRLLHEVFRIRALPRQAHRVAIRRRQHGEEQRVERRSG